VEGVALELAVCKGSLLEGSEPLHSVVRLPEHAQTEQSNCDDEHGSAYEGYEQLNVHLRREMADRSGERIVAATQQAPLLGDGCCPLLPRLSL
jgi:hypothetical protein